MKIAITGTGSIGQRHIRNLQTLCPTARFVFWRESGRIDAISEALHAPVVSDTVALDAQAPDAIVIATPSALHTGPLLHAIRKGIAIYIEKPVVTTQEDIALIRQTIASTGLRAPALVGHNLRFLPSLQRMHAMVRDDVIGPVHRGLFEAGQWLPDWRPTQNHRQSYSADPTRGGGVILDLVHEIDAARWMCGDLDLAGAAATRASVLGIGTEAAAVASLGGGDQPAVSIALDYLSQVPIRRYRLVGAKGTLDWDLGARELRMTDAEGLHEIDCGMDGFNIAATYPAAMSAWLAAIKGQDNKENQMLNEFEDGLQTTMLALRIRDAAPC